MADITSLNKQFSIPGIAEIIAGKGGLAAIRITSKDATGTVYLHGAHVTAWQPADAEEVLWMSAKSGWVDGKPIRGGVPLCFPWFGPHKETPNSPLHPMHGFARLREWTLDSIQQSAAGVTVTLSLKSDDATRAAWPHDFVARHRITFGKTLHMALECTNTGTSPLKLEDAQHTYFSLADARNVRVKGLAGTRFVDKTDAFKVKPQDGDIILTGETNRIYLDTTSTLTLEDPGKRRRIAVVKENSRSTVVWNPWSTVAKTMADFGDDSWTGMMCIETCNVDDAAVTVKPGETHAMATTLSVQPL